MTIPETKEESEPSTPTKINPPAQRVEAHMTKSIEPVKLKIGDKSPTYLEANQSKSTLPRYQQTQKPSVITPEIKQSSYFPGQYITPSPSPSPQPVQQRN